LANVEETTHFTKPRNSNCEIGHLYTPEVCSRLILDSMLLVNVHRFEKCVSLYYFWRCTSVNANNL